MKLIGFLVINVLLILIPIQSNGQDTTNYFLNLINNRSLNTCNEGFEKIEVSKEVELLNRSELYRRIVDSKIWKLCRDAGLSGYTKIQFLVNEKGECVCYRIIEEQHIFISLCYTEQINWMKFKPGLKDGNPIESWSDTLILKIAGGIE